MSYRHGKTRLAEDIVMAGMANGFGYGAGSNRERRRELGQLEPHEQPGSLLKKFIARDPDRAPLIQELTAKDFNHRWPNL